MALTLFLVFLYAAGTALVLPTPLEAVLAGVKFAPGWAVIVGSDGVRCCIACHPPEALGAR